MRRTLIPANLDVCKGEVVVGEQHVAGSVKNKPVLPTRAAARSIRLCLVKGADLALWSPGSAVDAILGEELTTGEEETSVPDILQQDI